MSVLSAKKDLNLNLKLTPRQAECYTRFWDPQVEAVLYGGARGGGKSFLGCYLVFIYAVHIMKEFGLEPQKYPPPIAFMGRARGVDFVDTTLETWKAIIPSDAYVIRPHEKEIVIEDTVKVLYGGLDNVEDIGKFKSGELGMIFLDQAEECDRDAVADLRGCLRKKINGRELPYKELYTANPAQCWLKDEFVLGNNPKKVFVQALPGDNPFLPKSYVDRLQEAYRHRPELVQAYLYGSWDALEGNNVIIKEAWVRQARKVVRRYDYPRVVIGVDVARYGDDSTVAYVLRGTDIVDCLVLSQKDTMQVAANIAILANRWKAEMVGVDAIGVGAGVADRLRELGVNVLDVNSSEKASEAGKFRNLRAEMWWKAGEMFANQEIQLTYDDPDLVRELTSVNYEIRKGLIQVEDKERVKRRLGKSPDKADAYIIALYTLQVASAVSQVIRYHLSADDYVRSRAGKYSGF